MVRLILLFVLFGPLVGCFVYWEIAMIGLALNLGDFSGMSPEGIASIKNATIGNRLFKVFMTGPIMGTIGYPFALLLGAIPATATAISYWTTLRFGTKKNLTYINRGLVGGLLGLIVATAYGMTLSQVAMGGVFEFWTMPGTISSAICAMCVGNSWYSKVFPNRSEEKSNISTPE
jgi:hypothetical protein